MDEKDQRETDDEMARRYTKQRSTDSPTCTSCGVPAGAEHKPGCYFLHGTLREFVPVSVMESVRSIHIDLGRAVPHEQCEFILTGPLTDAIQLFVRRQAEYGEEAGELGSMGQYADINRKVRKLKRLMWDKSVPEDAISEDAEQVCMDLIGHLLLSIQFLREEKS